MPTKTISRKIGSRTLRELKPFIARTISSVLNDPDFGLELSDKAQSRLSQARKVLGKTVSFSEIKKRYS